MTKMGMNPNSQGATISGPGLFFLRITLKLNLIGDQKNDK